jgi:ariadne-1
MMNQASTAALLLRYMSWNKERLIEKYMDNASTVSVNAGISPAPPKPTPSAPIRSSNTSSRLSAASSAVGRVTRRSATGSSKTSKTPKPVEPPVIEDPKPFICPICYDDTQTTYLSLSCDHRYCSSCWKMYIMSKIRDEGEHAIRCMGEGCAVICPDPFVQSALEEGNDTWSRFQELVVRHFVASNPNLKYCPYPACTYTVSCPTAASKSILTSIVPTVSCGASATHKFCFGCPIDGDHRPVVCSVARMWLKKCRDDSETANWIKSNTKECTQCQSTIEKNGGCKYVVSSFVGYWIADVLRVFQPYDV